MSAKYKVVPTKLTKEVNKKIDNQIDSTDQPFPDRREWIIAVVGRKGSGKTSLIVNLLSSSFFRKRYDNIILISPSHRDEKLKPLIEELTADGKFYNKLTNDNLNEIMTNINEFNDEFKERYKGKIPKNLLLIDDSLADLPLSSQKQSAFNKLMTNHRHAHTSIILSTQKFKSLNTIARNNLDGLIAFRTSNQGEIDSMCDEFGIDEELYLQATDEPHAFLYCHFFNNNKKSYFLNFDKLIPL